MKEYLESGELQAKVAAFFALRKPIGAICHGVLLAARCRRADGRSVLEGYRTTALTEQMELFAWNLTKAYVGDYYRTYPKTLQREVTELIRQGVFDPGPSSRMRWARPRLSGTSGR
jgi:putative intracellular protease/amidase